MPDVEDRARTSDGGRSPADRRTTGGFRVAAVQATPAYLDREATLAVVADNVARAGADGADLVVFRESFVPGYLDWVWRRAPTSDGDWYRRFQEQAVELSGPALDTACSAAAAAGVWVALGVTEGTASGTLYNAVVYIDGAGDIGGVKVGSLICWEAYMPLARAALYQKGIDVLLAPTWDNSDEWVPTLRHIAKEGRLFVVGVSAYLRGCDIPRDLPGADDTYGGEEDLLSRGNTTTVAPGGEILAGPLIGSAGTVTAKLDLDLIAAGRRSFDPVGHYARPDVLALTITTTGATDA